MLTRSYTFCFHVLIKKKNVYNKILFFEMYYRNMARELTINKKVNCKFLSYDNYL